MGTYSFNLSCACCSIVLFSVTGAEAQAWKDDAAIGGHKSICSICGCEFKTVDDGVSVSSGGGVQRSNISSPRLDSLDITGGSRAGGTEIVLSGHSFDIGNLIVKFGDKPVIAILDQTASSVRVVTPVGQYALSVQEYLSKIEFASTTGDLSIGSTITSPLGSEGILRAIEGGSYWIGWQPLKEPLAQMADVTLSSSSGGSGVVSSAVPPDFIVGEEVEGLASGAKGVFKSLGPFVVDAPTAAFGANELVQGNASRAYIYTSTAPHSGAVDVSVENENGQRVVGGAVVNGFTYL